MSEEPIKSTLINTLGELDSLEAFMALVVIPVGGMALQALSYDGTAKVGERIEWMEAGYGQNLSSFDIISNWMASTDKPFQARLIDFDD